MIQIYLILPCPPQVIPFQKYQFHMLIASIELNSPQDVSLPLFLEDHSIQQFLKNLILMMKMSG